MAEDRTEFEEEGPATKSWVEWKLRPVRRRLTALETTQGLLKGAVDKYGGGAISGAGVVAVAEIAKYLGGG